jgi:hypothetical protein
MGYLGQGMNASMNDTHNLSELLHSVFASRLWFDRAFLSLEDDASPERVGGYVTLEDRKPP